MSDDKKVSDLYRELPREEPPRALDEAILAASHRRPARWAGPLALAAVLVLAVAVGVQVEREKPDAIVMTSEPKPVPQAKPAPKPAEAAPVKRAFTPDPPKPAAPPPLAERADSSREARDELAARQSSRAEAAPAPTARLAPLAKVAERWFLMARHGECAEVATLKRRVPELGEINDPQAFVALMRGQGYEVAATPVPVPQGRAWEVRVPAKELFLVFVTAEMCSGAAAR